MTFSLSPVRIRVFLLSSLIALIGISLLGCSKIKSDPAGGGAKSETGQNANISTLPSPEEYQLSVENILKPFWQKDDISGVKEKLLELTVPAKYLDLHFNLVVAFELLEQGRKTGDQSKIEQGLETINDLKAQYEWLE